MLNPATKRSLGALKHDRVKIKVTVLEIDPVLRLSVVHSSSWFLEERIPVTFHPLFSKELRFVLFGESFQFTTKFKYP